MEKTKQFCIDKLLPILITAGLSALISILGNILSAYTGAHVLQTNPEAVGTLGLALKSVHSATQC